MTSLRYVIAVHRESAVSVESTHFPLWPILKCLIDLCKFRKRKLFCAYVDYEQAFDKINRKALWHKLIQSNISGKLLNVIKSMYANIKSCVSNDGMMSDFFSSGVGVRQGENLSPILFALFVNDLQNFFELNDCRGIYIYLF